MVSASDARSATTTASPTKADQVATERTGSAAAMKGLTMPKDDATLSAASAGSVSYNSILFAE
jgi:hypothetical protein